MSGYEKSPDYGSPMKHPWRNMIIATVVMFVIAYACTA